MHKYLGSILCRFLGHNERKLFKREIAAQLSHADESDGYLLKVLHRKRVCKRCGQQREVKQKQETFMSTWTEREATFKATVSDYDDYINRDSLERLNPGQMALAFIAESGVGPQILYELLTDEELAEKFAIASDVRKVALLSKIESNFDSDEPSVSKTKTAVTKAPQPAKSLPKGKAVATSKSIYDANLSFTEYNRLMDERDRAKKRK